MSHRSSTSASATVSMKVASNEFLESTQTEQTQKTQKTKTWSWSWSCTWSRSWSCKTKCKCKCKFCGGTMFSNAAAG